MLNQLSYVLLLAWVSIVFPLPSLAASNPDAPLIAQIKSHDPAMRQKGAEAIGAMLDSPDSAVVHHAVGMLHYDWMNQLAKNGQDEAVVKLALKAILAAPNKGDYCEGFQRDRVKALLKLKRYDAAASVTWAGGSAVAGHPRQRSVSKSTSAHTNVTATCGNTSADLDVWVMWASVTIKKSGTNPTNAPQFDFYDYDGTQNLGPVTFVYGTQGTQGAGKVCIVGKLTPTGVNAVVKTGWSMPQDRMTHDLVDGAHAAGFWDTTWTCDGPDPDFIKATPDEDDQIYAIDGPTVGQFQNAQNTFKVSNNFRDRVLWMGSPCSDYSTWYYKATWTNGANPQINPNDVNIGSCTLY